MVNQGYPWPELTVATGDRHAEQAGQRTTTPGEAPRASWTVPSRGHTAMTTGALIAVGISTAVTYAIRELGAGLRQRSALRSVERLAENQPTIASLVPWVVEAATSTRGRNARQLRPPS
jgi:hypothetical protein